MAGMSAWADGKVFPAVTVPSTVAFPDQRALISWANDVEHLVIETRLAGSGTNFAWVVPLPSPPTVAPGRQTVDLLLYDGRGGVIEVPVAP